MSVRKMHLFQQQFALKVLPRAVNATLLVKTTNVRKGKSAGGQHAHPNGLPFPTKDVSLSLLLQAFKGIL